MNAAFPGKMGGVGRMEKSFRISMHHFGPKNVAVIQSREVAVKQGFYSRNACVSGGSFLSVFD